jgi:hypothetical protein
MDVGYRPAGRDNQTSPLIANSQSGNSFRSFARVRRRCRRAALAALAGAGLCRSQILLKTQFLGRVLLPTCPGPAGCSSAVARRDRRSVSIVHVAVRRAQLSQGSLRESIEDKTVFHSVPSGMMYHRWSPKGEVQAASAGPQRVHQRGCRRPRRSRFGSRRRVQVWHRQGAESATVNPLGG